MSLKHTKSTKSSGKDFRFKGFGRIPTSRKRVPVYTDALLAKDGSVITDTLLAKKENNYV